MLATSITASTVTGTFRHFNFILCSYSTTASPIPFVATLLYCATSSSILVSVVATTSSSISSIVDKTSSFIPILATVQPHHTSPMFLQPHPVLLSVGILSSIPYVAIVHYKVIEDEVVATKGIEDEVVAT